jgi:uncharacterized protein (DUF2267 family)
MKQGKRSEARKLMHDSIHTVDAMTHAVLETLRRCGRLKRASHFTNALTCE